MADSVTPIREALGRHTDGNHRFVNELSATRARFIASREWRARLLEAIAPWAAEAPP